MNQSLSEKMDVPTGIHDYINSFFIEDFITEVRPYTDHHGNLSWFVDVTHHNSVYHLRFNKEGLLIDKDIETVALPSDDTEMGEGD